MYTCVGFSSYQVHPLQSFQSLSDHCSFVCFLFAIPHCSKQLRIGGLRNSRNTTTHPFFMTQHLSPAWKETEHGVRLCFYRGIVRHRNASCQSKNKKYLCVVLNSTHIEPSMMYWFSRHTYLHPTWINLVGAELCCHFQRWREKQGYSSKTRLLFFKFSTVALHIYIINNHIICLQDRNFV